MKALDKFIEDNGFREGQSVKVGYDNLKEFINQRVLEELEEQKDSLIKVYGDMCEETFHSYVDGLISSTVKRIKELKQD